MTQTDEAITIIARAIYETFRHHAAEPMLTWDELVEHRYSLPSFREKHTLAIAEATAALEALRAAGYWVETPPRVRSRWPGWDRSRGPWSAALHQDSVCSAVFRDGYAAEDARALLSFIDRTWGPPPVQSEGGGG